MDPQVPNPDDSRVEYSELLEIGDPELMQQIVGGNADAFAVIFKRYHRLVYGTALNILRDAAEAEDLTQNVFLEVYRKANQFEPTRGTLKIWLLQFAYSRSVSRRNYLMVRQHGTQAELDVVEEEN